MTDRSETDFDDESVSQSGHDPATADDGSSEDIGSSPSAEQTRELGDVTTSVLDDLPKVKLAGELVQKFYHELRRIADLQLRRESRNHTLQPTALVHEAFLRLSKQRKLEEKSRTSMLAAGAKLMRRVLVDHARKRNATKRGGGQQRLLLADDLHLTVSPNDPVDIVIMDDLIESLALASSRAARLVELRFFGGLTNNEVAETLGVSPRTVDNDWRFARAWIRRELSENDEVRQRPLDHDDEST